MTELLDMFGIAEVFWSFVDRGGPADCWLWRGQLKTNVAQTAEKWVGNYGRFRVLEDPGYPRYGKPETVAAHRMAWALTHRRWPDGLILHSCDNPPCVNPAHLSEGTYEANARDRTERGRSGRRDTGSHWVIQRRTRARARSRAHFRLKALYEDDFRRLYAEELALERVRGHA